MQAEGTILVFIIYLIPGFPKDIVTYLFGISPIGAWPFAIASIVGRMPWTWVLSAQGARTATGQYTELAVLVAVMAAVVIPLYYYRQKILKWIRGFVKRRRNHARVRSAEREGCFEEQGSSNDK